MESSNARLVLGLALGAALGLAGGWVLRSAGEEPARRAPSLALDAGAAPRAEPARDELPTLTSQPERSDERRVAPPSAERALPLISEERIDELAASVERPRVEREAGGLAITGRVIDESSSGLAQVVLRATRADPSARSVAPSSVGQAPPPLGDFDRALRDAARTHAEKLARTFEATSDAFGVYRIERLPAGRYRVEAFQRDHLIEAAEGFVAEVPAGAELDFTARPVLRVPVRVTLADGAVPESAVLTCKRPGESRKRDASYAWSPAEPELRLVPGNYEIFAIAGLIESGAVRELVGELSAEPQMVELVLGAPIPELSFVLGTRPGIRGRVTFAKDGIVGGTARVQLLALGTSGELDLAQLARTEQGLSLRGDDDYAFIDLEPGRYAVGVTRSSEGPVCAHREVEVGAGVVTCDLEVPPLDLSQYLAVRARGAAGEPLENLSFQFMHRMDSGSSSRGLFPMRGPDRVYLVTIPNEGRASYFAGTEGHEFELGVKSEEYGSKQFTLAPGQTELDVSFQPPATLDVLVAGVAGSGYAGRLRLALAGAGQERTGYGGGDIEVKPDGSARFEAREPGNYELSIWLTRDANVEWGRRSLILMQPVQLVAGANAARVAMPALYAVAVRWTGGTKGVGVQLHPRGFADDDPRAEIGSDWTTLDENARARFDTVPAGSYTLSSWTEAGDSVEKDIEVPCGEVELRPE